jgi:hypothetical protein
MVIKFITALFFCSLVWSCSDHSHPHTGTVVNGNLIHANRFREAKTIYFYAAPETFNLLKPGKNLVDSGVVHQDGFYEISLNGWEHPGFFDLKFGDEIIASNYFIKPGEKITLDFDLTETPGRLMSRSRSGKYNQFLQAFSDLFYRNPGVKQYYYVESNFLLAPEYATYIDKRHKEELIYADGILRTSDVDTFFRNYLINEINYQWANDKTAFLWKKWIRNEEVPLNKSYFNYLQELPADNPQALISPAYYRFLQLYIREMYRQLPISRQNSDSSSYIKCDIASKKTTGMAFKIALMHILNDDLSNAKNLGNTNPVLMDKAKALAKYMVSVTGDEVFIRRFEQEQ